MVHFPPSVAHSLFDSNRFPQVLFEGIRGSSYSGDIALDDISFTVGASNCILRPSDALPPGMTTVPPVTGSSTVSPTTIGRWYCACL